MKKTIFALLSLLIILFWSACGTNQRSAVISGESLVTTQKPASISLSGEKMTTQTQSNESNISANLVTIHSIIRMEPDETLPLQASVTYEDGSTSSLTSGITYVSDNPEIVSIESGGILHAHTPGKTKIHAVYEGTETAISVEVLQPVQAAPTALRIDSFSDHIETGNTLQLQAVLHYDDGSDRLIKNSVVWQTDTPTLCTISSDGKVTARKKGTCMIEATAKDLDANLTLTITQPAEKVPYECAATLETETRFSDRFVNESNDDIDNDPKILFSNLSVTEIETLFNHARAADPTLNQPLVLPPQAVWDSYTSSQKVLYLVNAERCARGIRPMEGVDGTLLNDATKPYARFISEHESAFLKDPHRADGTSPQQRLEHAGIVLGENADYYGENIAMIGIANSFPQPFYQPEAKAVYAWLYQDKDEQYGHRNFILHTGYHDDTRDERSEGLLAAYTETYQYRDDKGFYWTKSYTVMDGFDPAPSWDYHLSDQERVTLYRRVRE